MMFLILFSALLSGGVALYKLHDYGLGNALFGAMIAASIFAALTGACIYFSNRGTTPIFRTRQP
jgi:hypothetical protein